MPDVNIRVQNNKTTIGKDTKDEIMYRGSNYNFLFRKKTEKTNGT